MTIEGFNTDLAVRVLARIEQSKQHPEFYAHHNQDTWGTIDVNHGEVEAGETRVPFEDWLASMDLVSDRHGNIVGVGTCGTSMCFAGHALSEERVPMLWEARNGNSYFVADKTSTGARVPVVAASMLGITRADCDGSVDDCCEDEPWPCYDEFPKMFDTGRTLDDLYMMVAEYAGLPHNDVRARVQRQIETFEAQDRERRAQIAARLRTTLPLTGSGV